MVCRDNASKRKVDEESLEISTYECSQSHLSTKKVSEELKGKLGRAFCIMSKSVAKMEK